MEKNAEHLIQKRDHREWFSCAAFNEGKEKATQLSHEQQPTGILLFTVSTWFWVPVSLMIYISGRLFRTAHADIFLVEHHQKVCVSTMHREKHVLKILSCRKKNAQSFCSFPKSWNFVNTRLCRLIHIYLFREWVGQCKGSPEAEQKTVWLKS